MNIDTYEITDNDNDIDSNFDSDIADFEIADDSIDEKAIKTAVKNEYSIRQKLDLINEKRSLDRKLDSFSHYWDI